MPPAAPAALPVSALPPLRTRSRADRWIPPIVAAAAFAALAVNLHRWPRLEDDEGTYVGQADAISAGLIAPYTYIYDHPFLGWLQMAPLLEAVQLLAGDGTAAIVTGRVVIALFGAVTATLLYLLGRRLGARPAVAVLAPVLWVSSGLVQDAGRAVYLDNIAVTWLLLALLLALNARQHMWHYLAAGMALAASILTKETFAIFGPAVLLAVWQSSWRRLRVMHLTVFLVAGALVLLSYPLFALLKGELLPNQDKVSLLGTLAWQLSGRDGSGSLFSAGSQRQEVVAGWLQLDGWVLVVGAACSLACLTVAGARSIGVAGLAALVPPVLLAGYLPPMYHLAMVPVFALAIAMTVEALIRAVAAPAGDGDPAAAVEPPTGHAAPADDVPAGDVPAGDAPAEKVLAGEAAAPVEAAEGGPVRGIEGLRGRPARWLRAISPRVATGGLGLVVLAASAVLVALPERADRVADAWGASGVGEFDRARAWVLANIPVGQPVITNGELWNDLHRAGWQPDEVVPYTKVDRDPALASYSPMWIVMTPTMRRDVASDPSAVRVRQAVELGRGVRQFGQYVVLRIDGPLPAGDDGASGPGPSSRTARGAASVLPAQGGAGS